MRICGLALSISASHASPSHFSGHQVLPLAETMQNRFNALETLCSCPTYLCPWDVILPNNSKEQKLPVYKCLERQFIQIYASV